MSDTFPSSNIPARDDLTQSNDQAPINEDLFPPAPQEATIITDEVSGGGIKHPPKQSDGTDNDNANDPDNLPGMSGQGTL